MVRQVDADAGVLPWLDLHLLDDLPKLLVDLVDNLDFHLDTGGMAIGPQPRRPPICGLVS